MLKPAMMYKTELEQKFAEIMYSEGYYYYVGHPHAHRLPELTDADNAYRWAIVDGDKVVGYLAYYIDQALDSAYGFGLYSFDEGNPVVGVDLFNELERLLSMLHRIEWRAINGNPVIRHYDKFCEKHHGNKVILHDCTKDMQGDYHDEYIYEIVNDIMKSDAEIEWNYNLNEAPIDTPIQLLSANDCLLLPQKIFVGTITYNHKGELTRGECLVGDPDYFYRSAMVAWKDGKK